MYNNMNARVVSTRLECIDKITRLYLSAQSRHHIVEHVPQHVRSALEVFDIMDDVTNVENVRILFILYSAYDIHVAKHNVSLRTILQTDPTGSNIILYVPSNMLGTLPRIYKRNTYDIQYFYNAYGIPNIRHWRLYKRLYPYITTYVKEYENPRVRVAFVYVTPPYINGEYDDYLRSVINDLSVSYVLFVHNKTLRYIGYATVIAKTVICAYACDICGG